MSIIKSLRVKIPLRVLHGATCSISVVTITQVVAGRNDDYGDRPVKRLLACIEWNRRWLRCRTIFVEWNPPLDRQLLSPMLTARFPDIRCYVISPALHSKVVKDCPRPFLEYHAKNVGIRRAETDWIAVCNSDVIVLPDCRSGMRRLDRADILRTRRVDFPFSGRSPTILQVLDSRKYLRFRCIEGIGASAPGDFTMAHRDIWNQARGYDEADVNRRVFCDVRGMHQFCEFGGRVKWIGTHLHFDHPESTSGGVTESHGECFKPDEGIPYRNTDAWGLGDAKIRKVQDRVWELDV